MDRYLVRIADEYLAGYKVKAGGEWVLTLVPRLEDAIPVDEDDHVITLCQKQCKNVQLIDPITMQCQTSEIALESPADDHYDWL